MGKWLLRPYILVGQQNSFWLNEHARENASALGGNIVEFL
jgi:hypothetical protein